MANIMFLSNNYFDYTDLTCWESWVKELMKTNHLEFWGYDFPEYEDFLTLEQIIKRRFGDIKPDYIFQFQQAGKMLGVQNVDIPKIFIFSEGDFMYDAAGWADYWNERKFDLIIVRVWSSQSYKWRIQLKNAGYELPPNMNNNFLEYDPVVKMTEKTNCPVLPLPHCIDPTMFKDYGLPKKYDVCMIGRRTHHYPVRIRGIEIIESEEYKNKYNSLFSVGLGYRIGWMGTPERDEMRTMGHYWGDEYAQKLNESRISITDGSVLNIAVPKYFEVPACNSVLMAPYPDNYERLHFEDGVNMVNVNTDNLKDKLNYYLENESECKKVARNGMEMINKYHTAEVRMKELYKIMEEYL